MAATPIHAYAFASTFRIKDVAQVVERAGGRIASANPKWPEPRQAAAEEGLAMGHPALDELTATFPDGGEAIFFDFGAAVFFGSPPEVRERVLAELARAGAEEQRPRTEEFLVEVQPGAPLAVRFDRVVLPELSFEARQVIALLLAQSAAMDYYEDDVSEILARTERITRGLAERGRLRGRVRELVKFIGSCIRTKNEIVETLSLFDKPEATWENEAIDRLFVRLREMLEIDDRFRALEYRLRGIQDNLALLVDLSRSSSNLSLELAIFVLILVELLLSLWQVLHATVPR